MCVECMHDRVYLHSVLCIALVTVHGFGMCMHTNVNFVVPHKLGKFHTQFFPFHIKHSGHNNTTNKGETHSLGV